MSVFVSFVIPCYNSTPSLADLVISLTKLCFKENLSFEIILIQDSRDPETTALLRSIEKEGTHLRVVRLSKNFGQQSATVAGIVESSGDIIVTLDDDHQHLAEDAIAMVRQLEENCELDLIYARPLTPSDSKTRVRNGKILRTILRLSGLRFANSLSPFRAFRGSYREVFAGLPGPKVSVDVTLSWVVENVQTYECRFKPREAGVSGYNAGTLIRLALTLLVSYTVRPLVLGIYAGAIGIIFAVAFALVILANYVFGGGTLPGFATTTLLVLLLGSIQMLILGVLGIYLGEQHRRSLSQPLFLIMREK